MAMTVEKKANNLNIYQKIVEVRRSIQHLTKDAQSHHHRYISGDALLSAIRPKMDELGIVLLTRVIEHTRENMIVDMTIEYDFINSDHPEDRFVVPWYASGRQNDPSQSIGSAMTYSERYVLKKTFLVPTDEDDPDAKPTGNNVNNKGKENGKTISPPKSSSQKPKEPSKPTPNIDNLKSDIRAMTAYLANMFGGGEEKATEFYNYAGSFEGDKGTVYPKPLDKMTSEKWLQKIHHSLKEELGNSGQLLEDAIQWYSENHAFWKGGE